MSLPPILRSLARRVIPSRLHPVKLMERESIERCAGRVWQGPFGGMKYGGGGQCSVSIAKLLGTYERELHPFIEQIVKIKPDVIVNVGADEGYYAVGLARLLTSSRVIAFETASIGQRNIAELAKLNDVAPRITVLGTCHPESLQQQLAAAQRPVVVCDVEGYEKHLIDLHKVPALGQSWILIETHDFIEAGLCDELVRRLSATHRATVIPQKARGRADYPFRHWYHRFLPEAYAIYLVNEFRPGGNMTWLWLEPKPLNGATG